MDLVTGIQQGEFNLPITYQDQPDLADIPKFFDMFWVTTHETTVVGTLGLKIINDFALIRKMFVVREFRGSSFGVAQKLLTALEEEVALRQIHRIYLGTTDFFKAAHKFYEKNGYIEILKAQLPSDFPLMSIDTRFFVKNL